METSCLTAHSAHHTCAEQLNPGIEAWPLAHEGHAAAFITNIDATALQEEVYSSSYAAAAYLESINFHKKVYVIGEDGILQVGSCVEKCGAGRSEITNCHMSHVTWSHHMVCS